MLFVFTQVVFIQNNFFWRFDIFKFDPKRKTKQNKHTQKKQKKSVRGQALFRPELALWKE